MRRASSPSDVRRARPRLGRALLSHRLGVDATVMFFEGLRT